MVESEMENGNVVITVAFANKIIIIIVIITVIIVIITVIIVIIIVIIIIFYFIFIIIIIIIIIIILSQLKSIQSNSNDPSSWILGGRGAEKSSNDPRTKSNFLKKYPIDFPPN